MASSILPVGDSAPRLEASGDFAAKSTHSATLAPPISLALGPNKSRRTHEVNARHRKHFKNSALNKTFIRADDGLGAPLGALARLAGSAYRPSAAALTCLRDRGAIIDVFC